MGKLIYESCKLIRKGVKSGLKDLKDSWSGACVKELRNWPMPSYQLPLGLGILATALWVAGRLQAQEANPLAIPSTLPLQAPRFDQIKDPDYKPAFEEAMKQ